MTQTATQVQPGQTATVPGNLPGTATTTATQAAGSTATGVTATQNQPLAPGTV